MSLVGVTKFVKILELIWSKPTNSSYPAVTYAASQHQGRLFWITCKRLKLLRKAGPKFAKILELIWSEPRNSSYPAVTNAASQHQGHLFWITCKRLKLLRKAGRSKIIQNSTPSVAGMRRCCIQIAKNGIINDRSWKNLKEFHKPMNVNFKRMNM